MSYRAYHDYDDDRDVITCVTLSDTRPVTGMQTISGARPGRWIRRLWRSGRGKICSLAASPWARPRHPLR